MSPPSTVLPAIIVVSGMQGAGKTTVAQLIACQFPLCAHIETDELTKLVVSGRRWPEQRAMSDEAALQLRLRLHNACLLARSFVEAGFSAVIDDIIMGLRMDDLLMEMAEHPFYFVMLMPSFEVVVRREIGRGTKQHEQWAWMDDEVRTATRRLGLWLDTSEQTADETVEEILSRVWTEGLIEQ